MILCVWPECLVGTRHTCICDLQLRGCILKASESGVHFGMLDVIFWQDRSYLSTRRCAHHQVLQCAIFCSDHNIVMPLVPSHPVFHVSVGLVGWKRTMTLAFKRTDQAKTYTHILLEKTSGTFASALSCPGCRNWQRNVRLARRPQRFCQASKSLVFESLAGARG